MQKIIKSIYSVFVLLLIVSYSQAQTFSPQSQFGLGNIHSPLFSANKGMGGIAAGFRSTRDINYLNPASYSALEYTTFDIGLQLYGNVISDSAKVADAANGGINHIALAFPIIRRKWSMALGLLPYSYKKYEYNSSVSENGVNYNYQSSGKGSTYNLFWGNGFQVKNFSLGVNTSFVFGELDESNNILFADSLNNINSSKHSQLNLKDVIFNFGVQYKAKISKLENLEKDEENVYVVLGAYGAPSFKLRSFSSNYTNSSLTSIITGEEVALDTVTGGVFNLKAQTTLPAYFGVGVAFQSDSKWITGIDFHFENWKKFSSPINNLSLGNEWHVKIGGQFLPDFKSKKFGKNMSYRLGAHFGKSRIMLDNASIPEFGTTFGFGIPLGKTSGNNRSLSRVNLSMEIGRRGTISDVALKENYYKLTLAYSLSDVWFIKRKFD
jgi:hypothetical protein